MPWDPRLYRNRGDGTFEETTEAAGRADLLDDFQGAAHANDLHLGRDGFERRGQGPVIDPAVDLEPQIDAGLGDLAGLGEGSGPAGDLSGASSRRSVARELDPQHQIWAWFRAWFWAQFWAEQGHAGRVGPAASESLEHGEDRRAHGAAG